MTTYYLDTSAAVKLYVSEIGSNWLAHMLAPEQSPVVLSSHLMRVELRSAFMRRLREASITLTEYNRMKDWLIEHHHTLYRFVPVDEAIIQRACALIEDYPLRGYDAIHLATALNINQQLMGANEAELTFLSADNRLNDAVITEGLRLDNPNNHL